MYDTKQALDCTIYASALSPCTQYLAVANNFGYLSIFHLNEAIKQPNKDKPMITFKAHNGEVFALSTVGKYLVSGGVGGVHIWVWKTLIAGKPAKKSTLNMPLSQSSGPYQSNEVNCLSSNNANTIITGRDDNTIHIWDLNAEKCVSSLNAHADYVHDVEAVTNSANILSSSEDGTVKMWDVRNGNVVNCIEPYKDSSISRPEYGKFISCVASDSNGEWIVCGGGPRLSLWHTRSMALSTPMQCDDFIPFVCKFYKEMIISAGSKSSVHHYNVNGSYRSAIPCSMQNVMSIAFDDNYTDLTTPIIVTGASYKIDVFCNPQYKTLSLRQIA